MIHLKQRLFIFLILLGCASCLRDAADPWSLAPNAPYANWTPQKGSTLISSQYCQNMVPPDFNDHALSLAELIDVAMQNNPQTKKTWALARVAAAQYSESLSPFMPNIDTQAAYTRERGTFVTLGTAAATYQTQVGPDVNLTYTLFDFGQRTSKAIATREALYYADFQHNQEIQNIIQTVMQDYYNYLYEEAELEAKRADLESAKMSLDAANEKFALGLVSLSDVAQARTKYLESKINLTSQKQTLEEQFSLLATDVGLPANSPFKVEPMPKEVLHKPILENVDVLVAKAQKQRYDLLAQQADIRSKQALVENAKRATRPVFATNMQAGHYWFNKSVQEDSFHWNLELTLSFPIFSGFSYKNQVKQAEGNLEASQATFLQTELSLIQSVTVSHKSVQTSTENLSDSLEYLKAAQLEFDIALTSYRSGVETILTLLSAQSSLADARSKKVSAERDWFLSLANLAHATGSLCRPNSEEL